MNRRIVKWLSGKYKNGCKSTRGKVCAIALGSLWEWIIIPLFFVFLAHRMDGLIPFKFTVSAKAKVCFSLISFFIGCYLTFRSIHDLARFGKGSFVPGAYPPKQLVKEGVYSMCRNPMYLGYIFLYIPLSMAFSSVFILLIAVPGVVIFLLCYTQMFEEKVLINEFGEEYLAYKKNTPFLLPKIKR